MSKKRPALKFIHTADWHLTNTCSYGGRDEAGVSRRLLDLATNIRKMLAFAVEKRVDFILVAGDIFHSRPDEVTRRVFAGVLRDFLLSGVQTFITIGQHDIGREGHFLETFSYVMEEFPLQSGNVAVLDELGNHMFTTVRSRANVNLVVQPWARDVYPREWKAWTDDEYINILLGHFPVMGAWASDTYEAEKGVEITQADIDPFAYVALGDFHRGDQLYYSGSIGRVTFSERDQAKGFKCVKLDPDTGEVRKVFFADVHDRPFIQVEVDQANSKANWLAVDPKNALVKLFVRGSSGFCHQFAGTLLATAKKQLRDRGAWDVIATYDIVKRERESRMAGMQVGISLDDAIEIYVEQEPPPGARGMNQLIDLGRSLLMEAREHEEP